MEILKVVNNEEEYIKIKRLVLGIYRMTIHNGPGIRTLVLFKGCPLRCLWCSTPESQKHESEIAIFPDKCTQCGKCISVCPLNAITINNEILSINRDICDNCGKCADVCYPEAIKLLGRAMDVEELLEEIKKDKVFYKQSGGGATLSGGEPLLYPDFTFELLSGLKKEGINIGIDTCGYVKWSVLDKMLPYIDFFLWDIKHMNPYIHKELTGVSNELILSNARAVSEKNIPIYIRIPVIPGYNNSEENIIATCKFVKTLTSVVEVDLMPLHHLGKAKYDSLNRACPISGIQPDSKSTLQKMKKLVQFNGLKCNIVS